MSGARAKREDRRRRLSQFGTPAHLDRARRRESLSVIRPIWIAIPAASGHLIRFCEKKFLDEIFAPNGATTRRAAAIERAPSARRWRDRKFSMAKKCPSHGDFFTVEKRRRRRRVDRALDVQDHRSSIEMIAQRRARAQSLHTRHNGDSLFFYSCCSNRCAVFAIRVSTEPTSPSHFG